MKSFIVRKDGLLRATLVLAALGLANGENHASNRAPLPMDVGVLSIDGPTSGSLLALESLSVTLFNDGPGPESGFPVSLTITGPIPAMATEPFGGVVPGLSTAPFTFATPIDLSLPGSYTITVSTALPGDPVPGNDSLGAMISHTVVDVGVDSIDSPVTGPGLTGSETLSVTLSNPGTSAESGFDLSFTVTGPIAGGAVESFGAVIAPLSTEPFSFATPLDLSLPGTYTITVSAAVPGDVSPGNDAVVALVTHEVPDVGVASIDAPVTGEGLTGSETLSVTLSNPGSTAESGFDVSFTVTGPIAGGAAESFGGVISPLSTEPFSFATPLDLSLPGTYTITVSTALAGDVSPGNDLSVALVTHELVDLELVSIDSPVSGTLTLGETVAVMVGNNGASAQSGFDVTYTVSGPLAVQVTETFTGTVLPLSTEPFVFATPANLKAAGTYTIDVEVDFADDVPGNDSTQVMVTQLGDEDLYVVDDDGGAGVDVLAIQEAIDAAGEGDTVEIRDGVYGGFVIDGKALSVLVAASASSVEITVPPVAVPGALVRIRNLGLVQSVTFGAPSAGVLKLRPQGVSAAVVGLLCEDNEGSILVENCFVGMGLLEASVPESPAVLLDACDSVTLDECDAFGHDRSNGATVTNTTVHLRSCLVRGGEGSQNGDIVPPAAAAGLEAVDSAVTAEDSLIKGGRGVDAFGGPGFGGMGYPGDGGPGVVDEDSTLTNVGSEFRGGPPGRATQMLYFAVEGESVYVPPPPSKTNGIQNGRRKDQ